MLRPEISTAAQWARSIDGAVAAWVEGSVARSTAGEHSDLDVHVAISDDRWSSTIADRHRILGFLAEVVTLREAGGERTWIMSAVLRGPWWVDVTLELASRLVEGVRTEMPLVLFDDAGWTDFDADAELIARARRDHLTELESNAAWVIAHGARVGRPADALLLTEYVQRVVWSVIAPAMLLAEGVLPRPHGDHARRLSPQDRGRVESLLPEPEIDDLAIVLDTAQTSVEAAIGRESPMIRRARALYV